MEFKLIDQISERFDSNERNEEPSPYQSNMAGIAKPKAKESAAIGLDFRILGPLDVQMKGQGLTVGGPRQRAILSALLLRANQVVSFDSLIENVWNGRPPSTARTQVAICIATLRKTFRSAGWDEETIITAAPGYMLNLVGHTLDSLRFEQLVGKATEWTAENRPTEAAAALREALALWRGPALGGVYAPFAETEAARLDEQRMLAVEQHMALRLQLGEHQAILAALQALVRACPLRDRLRYYLMLAQYRSGRRAEALTTFRDGMRHSIEEIGLELSADLQSLHNSILRDEFPQLAVPGFSASPSARQQSVPCQLPESDAYFVGRSRDQWLMNGALLDGSPQNPVPIAYITGSPGIGKTSLAVNWAHRSAHRFPDGQLFADLRQGEPLHVLHQFLRQLGAEGPLPTRATEAAELYRATLEGKRVLVILDHASSYAGLRQLLPGNGECCVLITGQANLDELLQKYCALRLRIGPMSDEESRELMTSVLRDSRADESPEATRQLSALCGHMPLVLRAAAAKLLTKQHWRVLDLVRRLERSDDRLAELSIGDDSLRARLELSLRQLGPKAASAYRELSVLDDADFEAAEAAKILGTDLLVAEDLIETLVDVQLLEVVGRSPWGEMHYRWQELVRLHAFHSLGTAPCEASLAD